MFLRPDALSVLRDKRARASLARYFNVMQDEKAAKFLIARKLRAEFAPEDTAEDLWKQHTALTKQFYNLQREIDVRAKSLQDVAVPKRSYLDLKIEIAGRILTECHFCTRRCSANRHNTVGYCKCGDKIAVSSIFEHFGEEPELVPSGTIFTAGCTMRCLHCQNWTISQSVEKGKAYEPCELADEVQRLHANGCRNANLVGGDPTPWLTQWLETFKHVRKNIPVVWNSNSYYSPETARLLSGFADVYLLDFKYGPGECSLKISDAPSYWEVSTRNHFQAKNDGELIVRLLILPDHLECCTKPIVTWIAGNLGSETRVNIMFQYRPEWRAHEIPELRRRLTRNEMERAIQLAKEANLTNYIT